jgi:hypothetical protein
LLEGDQDGCVEGDDNGPALAVDGSDEGPEEGAVLTLGMLEGDEDGCSKATKTAVPKARLTRRVVPKY